MSRFFSTLDSRDLMVSPVPPASNPTSVLLPNFARLWRVCLVLISYVVALYIFKFWNLHLLLPWTSCTTGIPGCKFDWHWGPGDRGMWGGGERAHLLDLVPVLLVNRIQ